MVECCVLCGGSKEEEEVRCFPLSSETRLAYSNAREISQPDKELVRLKYEKIRYSTEAFSSLFLIYYNPRDTDMFFMYNT